MSGVYRIFAIELSRDSVRSCLRYKGILGEWTVRGSAKITGGS
jgi:hypothetical protein